MLSGGLYNNISVVFHAQLRIDDVQLGEQHADNTSAFHHKFVAGKSVQTLFLSNFRSRLPLSLPQFPGGSRPFIFVDIEPYRHDCMDIGRLLPGSNTRCLQRDI